MVNYGHNQTVGFKDMCSQSLIKFGQTQSNLIDGSKIIGLGETRFSGKVFSGILGIGIVVRKCQWRNNFERWWTSC